MDTKTYVFVKVGQREHLEPFQKYGLLYMNTLEYFRNCEGISKDKNEGTKNILQGKRIKVVMFPHSNQAPFSVNLDSLQSTHSLDLMKNVFCMHAVSEDNLILDEENFKCSTHALIIFNPIKFLSQLSVAADKIPIKLQYGFVQYVDKKTYHGDMGCFKKFDEFKKESEFRILCTQGTGKPYELYIESLEDISMIVEAKEATQCIKNYLVEKGGNS